jgi:pyrimidine operon attenuation protein / uracil phosphoribosyltransferase
MSVAEKMNRVLDTAQVQQKITRIAYEIFENNFKEKTIVIAGIDGQGFLLAKQIANELGKISAVQIRIVKVSLDKLAPLQSEVVLDADARDLKKKCVVLVDDVLNTGRTLAYGMKPFLNVEVKKIEVAVLVNRSNTLFPITPTYTGYELATTLTDRVEVVLGKNAAVNLK